MPSSPESRVRSLRSSAAALESWALTVDRPARTAAARRASEQRFLDMVPAAITDPEERARRAESLRTAHYRRMAAKSVETRARRRKLDAQRRELEAHEQATA